MSGCRLYAIILRQFYLLRGSVARLMPLFIWVAIDIVLWGFITKYLNSVSPGYNFVPAILGAVLLWDFLTRVMQGVTMAFFEDVWSRNFLNVFASPIRIGEYVGGLVTTSILTSAVGLVVMLILSNAIFHLSFFSYGILLAPSLFILFLTGIALGVFASGIVLRVGPAAEWFIWPIPAFISPFSGVFYPLATLPQWMQTIAHLLPPSYIFETLRALVHDTPMPEHGLLWGFSLAIIYLLLAFLYFLRVYKHAVNSGLIARYSAETVS